MRMSNAVMLGVALVCAALAAFLSRVWLAGQPAAPQQAVTTTRAIVVAARDLKPGDKLDKDMLRALSWPGETLPKGAFLSADALLKRERIVESAIAENEPVLEQKLVGTLQNPLAAKLADSMNAVTIRVNDVAGVAGFIGPGDLVDVFLTYGGRAGDAGPSNTKPSTVVLLQNVRVLAADQVTERKAQATPPKAVTVEVNTEDAQKLILSSNLGQLSLALKRSGDSKGATRPIGTDDLLPGGQNAQSRSAPGGKDETGPVVTVTRSVERKEYRVAPEGQKDDDWQHQNQNLRH